MAELSGITPDQADEAALEAAQDYNALRSLGLNLLGKLGTDIWTDFNVHDPGITMLEIITYAMTDLGYRTAFPMEDILAQAGTDYLSQYSFYTPAEILPDAPVTFDDFRKLFIDQAGVSNAWITEASPFSGCKGLRDIYIQPTDPAITHHDEKQLRTTIAQVFWANRNLGEALHKIHFLHAETIVLQLQLVVQTGYIPENVVASALVAIGDYLQGQVSFSTLAQAIEASNGRVDVAFEGPLLTHGFVSDDQLLPQVSQVHPDELLRVIRNLPGVESVIRLSLLPQFVTAPKGSDNFFQTLNPDGSLDIGPQYYPSLSSDLSKFEFKVMLDRKNYTLDQVQLQNAVTHLQSLEAATRQNNPVTDLPVPAGRNRNLETYYTVQYDFPAIYNLGPALAPAPMPAPVAQMRGFLLLFDQVLADYLSQLAHAFELFSWDPSIKSTYFSQTLENALQDMVQLLAGMPSLNGQSPDAQQQKTLAAGLLKFRANLALLRESVPEFLDRRQRFLNHVLARFGRDLEEYLDRLPTGDPETQPRVYIAAVERMLADYPSLSSRRGTGGEPMPGAETEWIKSGIQDVVESIFALPVMGVREDEIYGRFNVTITPQLGNQTRFGQMLMTPEDDAPVNFPKLMQLGVKEENYHLINASPPGYSGLTLYGSVLTGEPGSVYNFVNIFPDDATGQAAIRQTARLFREFSIASERLYFIDHILLKPLPEDPVHGLLITGTGQDIPLKSNGWYPLKAMEQTAGITAANSAIQYGEPEPAPQGSPPDSPPFSPPSPPWSPPADDSKPFLFTILAWQYGFPYPVFPPAGIPLPESVLPWDVLVTAIYPAAAMRAYVDMHYSNDIDNLLLLGQQLTADFQADLLPADWVIAGKSEVMQQWGRYLLYNVLTEWQNDYSPYPDFGTALIDAILFGPDAGWGYYYGSTSPPLSPPDSPPLSPPASPPGVQAGRPLLITYARDYYFAKASSAAELVNALELDLNPATEPPEIIDANARVYLSCTGKALGDVFLATYYPGMQKEQLGSAIATGMGLQVASGLEQTMESIVISFLGESYKTASSPPSGTVFLDSWLQGIGTTVYPDLRQSLQDSGLELWNAWLAALSPLQGLDTLELGVVAGIWMAANPLVGSPPAAPSSLPDIVAAQVSALYGFPYYPPTDPRCYSLTPSYVDLGALESSSPPGDIATRLVNTMTAAIQWYLRYVLCNTASLSPQAQTLLDTLGLSQDKTDKSLWSVGDIAISYYCQMKFPGTTFNAYALGFQMQKLIAGVLWDITSDPVLAAIGAYTLTDYLSTLSQSDAAKGMTVGQFLYNHYYGGCNSTSPPPASPPVTDANLPADIVSCLGVALEQLTNIQDTGWQTGTGSLYASVNAASLSHFLVTSLPPTASTASEIDGALLMFQMPEDVSALESSVDDILTGVGAFYLKFYLLSHFTWQVADATALGNAIAGILPVAPPAGNPVTTPGLTLPQLPAPIQYAVRLGYLSGDMHVRFFSETYLDSQQAAEQQIASVCQSIPQVEDGTLAFQAVFTPLYYPPVQGDSRDPASQLLNDPFSSQLTVIAPDWPLRFQEKGFRDRMQQVVAQEAPAHILTRTLWFSKLEMQDFEFYYKQWISRPLDDPGRDYMGQRILQMILSHSVAPVAKLQVLNADAP